MDTKLVDKAARFAIEAHSGVARKGDGLPYIIHPFEVATIAGSVTNDQEVIAAALLHDVVEDTEISAGELRDRFGARVAVLVASETEDKMPDVPKDQSWRLRKERSLEALAAAEDPGIPVLWLADKLSNLRSFARLREAEGSAMWEHFNQRDPAQHAWYYRSVAKLTEELGATRAWRELTRLIGEVFGEAD